MSPRPILVAFGALLLLPGCIDVPTSSAPQVTVRHRCGDTNFNDLSGTYGKMQGENGINAKYRVLFETVDGALGAKWVTGGHDRHGLQGVKSDDDHAVFTETGTGRRVRIWATITNDCRIEAQTGWVDGSGAEEKSPEPAAKYAAFPDLANRDFEPCTERLYFGGTARSWSKAKASKAPKGTPSVRSSEMTIAAFGPKGEVGPGCRGTFDVWTDGQGMDAIGVETVEASGDKVRWHMSYTNDYVGKHGIAMHRKVKCEGGEETLVGVACVEIEVK
jgi:hypothetical protein